MHHDQLVILCRRGSRRTKVWIPNDFLSLRISRATSEESKNGYQTKVENVFGYVELKIHGWGRSKRADVNVPIIKIGISR